MESLDLLEDWAKLSMRIDQTNIDFSFFHSGSHPTKLLAGMLLLGDWDLDSASVAVLVGSSEA